MQNHLHSPSSTPPRDQALPLRGSLGQRQKRILGSVTCGGVLGGVGFLLGSCPLLWGAAPLGLGFLAASSSYTWYILGGLLLSAALRPVTLSGWVWAGIYLLCVFLRIFFGFFQDPSSPPPHSPRRGRELLRLCLDSLQRDLGLTDKPLPEGNTGTDRYAEGKVPPRATPRQNPPEGEDTSPAPRLFGEHPFLRMLTGAACGLLAGVCVVISGGFHVFDLMGALCLLLITPLTCFFLISCFGEAGLTLLFSPAPLGRENGGLDHTEQPIPSGRVWQRFTPLPLLSVCLLLAATVYAARGFSLRTGTDLLRLGLAPLLGMTLTLLTSSRLGTLPGIVVGAICGLAVHPRSAPMYVLCAVSYALLRYISPRIGVLGGCAVGAVWCAMTEGVLVLAQQLPAILLTMPLFLIIQRLWGLLPEKREAARADRRLEEFTSAVAASLIAQSRAEAERLRMKALAETFGSLSRRFYDLSVRFKKPRPSELKRICEESFGDRCTHCSLRHTCREGAYEEIRRAQAQLAAQLLRDGIASTHALPPELWEQCPHLESILEDINLRYARMAELLLKGEKTEIFAEDYGAIASLLNHALEEDSNAAEDFACNREAADAVYDYLTGEGVSVQGVVVGGGRESPRKRVIVRAGSFTAVADRLPTVRSRIGELLGCPMGVPSFDEGEDGGASAIMTLSSEARLKVSYSGSTLPGLSPSEPSRPRLRSQPPPLTHETPPRAYSPPGVCGDHIALFKSDNACFYALISDGMGSGEEASTTSDICAMFLEKMLSAGNRVEVSLRMLDSILRSKNTGTGEECSATVDLMELDLMDGQAVFTKNGAAPTYVVREGTVYKLHSTTLPMGILKNTPSGLLRFRTHPGDVVVMVSDGVTLGNDECPWLIDLLSSPMPSSMDSLRKDIIRRALTAGSEDDLSAIAIRVEPCEPS